MAKRFLPDSLWEQVEPLLPRHPLHPNGGNDFTSPEPAAVWNVLATEPSIMQPQQVTGRLELPASANPAAETTAGYYSNEWVIDLFDDFAMRIDYHVDVPNQPSGDVGIAFAAVFNGSPNPAEVFDGAIMFVGKEENFPYVGYTGLLGGVPIAGDFDLAPGPSGTAYLSFDAGADALKLSFSGYDDPNPYTISGLRNASGATDTFVFLGGYSSGTATAFSGNQMWLDNVCIDFGAIIDDPDEPCSSADLNCDGMVNVSDLLILFDNWGACDDCGDCPADLNGDCVVNVSDLLVLFDNWG